MNQFNLAICNHSATEVKTLEGMSVDEYYAYVDARVTESRKRAK